MSNNNSWIQNPAQAIAQLTGGAGGATTAGWSQSISSGPGVVGTPVPGYRSLFLITLSDGQTYECIPQNHLYWTGSYQPNEADVINHNQFYFNNNSFIPVGLTKKLLINTANIFKIELLAFTDKTEEELITMARFDKDLSEVLK